MAANPLYTEKGTSLVAFSIDGSAVRFWIERTKATPNQLALLELAPRLIAAVMNDKPFGQFAAEAMMPPIVGAEQ